MTRIRLVESVALVVNRVFPGVLWRNHYRNMSLSETFDHVYARGLWGREPDGHIHSGTGSRGELFDRYCELVVPELTRRGVRSLVDIGCGDFKVGAVLSRAVDDYTGVDVSELAVTANHALHASQHCRFVRADATRDPLPHADAAVLKQVLQHLGNAQIESVLGNILSTYRVVFITEDLHADSESLPNRDMVHGPHTRVTHRSGVRIDLPPFNIPVTLLGDIPYSANQFIRTWMVERQ
jgi:SAM-dependent methyltransferase